MGCEAGSHRHQRHLNAPVARAVASSTRRGRTRVAVLLVGAGLLAAGCTDGSKREPSLKPPVQEPNLKRPVQGLLDREHFPAAGYTGAVRAFVVNTTWASLQPTSDGPIVRPNDIDRAIEQARSSGMTLKLRVRAGIDAPAWAKRIGGPPIPMYYTRSTVKKAGQLAGTIGRFWDPQYGAAYADLQTKLAALYDGVPEVRQTGVTRCGTIFTETFLRNTRDARNARALLAGGFSRAADERCHNEQLTAHLVWQRTHSGIAFNPYQVIQPDGSKTVDLAYTLAQMDHCRAVLGMRCVLENYSLSSRRLCDPDHEAMHAKMRQLGPPYDFQTATASKIGSYRQVLDWAVSFGASSVELPAGYRAWPPATLDRYTTRLTANPTHVTTGTRRRAAAPSTCAEVASG
jgi:hypothetical protein